MKTKPSAYGIVVGLLACCAAALRGRAETIAAGPFSLDVSPRLTLRCDNAVLFSGERCVVLRSPLGGVRPSLVGPIEEGELLRRGNVLTLLARKGRNSLRREVMVTPEAVHLTFELQVFGATGGTHLQYELLTPTKTLEGTSCKVTKGLLRRPRTTAPFSFEFAKTKPGTYLFQTALYVELETPACTLDFNPMGPWQGISNYGENWSVSPYHDGKRVHFSMFCSAARNGATFTGKVVIRRGNVPYETVHPNQAVAYTTEFPTTLALNFSENDADGRYRACPAVALADDTPFGWREPGDVIIVPRRDGGLLRRAFAAQARQGSEGVLELRLPSGLYLLTLNVYDGENDTGPFGLGGPEGDLLSGIRIPAGTYWDKTVPLRVRNGLTALRFSGAWKINALALQQILRDEEDFLFERPYWNMALEDDGN